MIAVFLNSCFPLFVEISKNVIILQNKLKNMKLYPNAKINLGLNILRKRTDGYHDLETIFYPIQLCDELEIIESDHLKLILEGNPIDGDINSNLVIRAYRLLEKEYQLPLVQIKLKKIIPTGAGLGGGSSDAAYILIGLNQLFDLNIPQKKLAKYAARLGADCAFFIYNQPMLGAGIGDRLTPVKVDLKNYYLALVKPHCFVSTADAYSNIKPATPDVHIGEGIKQATSDWKNLLFNDFEESIFPKFPEIKNVKELLYKQGAVYACMSGSGASVFGIFKNNPIQLGKVFSTEFLWIEQLQH